MTNEVKYSRRRAANKLALTPIVFAAALLAAPLTGNAYTVSTMKICDAATQSCEGNPETDIFKVTIVNDSGTDNSFTVDWLVPAGTGNLPSDVDLMASSTWTITNFDADDLDLSVVISNDTDLSAYPSANSAILSFGFGVEPDSTATLATAGSTFVSVGEGSGGSTNQNFPGGFKAIDVCVFTAGCSGGDVNTGLQAGEMDTVALNVSPDAGTFGSPNTIELLFFPLKFQGTWGSFEPGGTPGGGGGGDPGGVPVPAPLALIGLGALWFRRLACKTA